MASPLLEILTRDKFRCGEAPTWDRSTGRLLWCDIETAVVFSLRPATGEATSASPCVLVSAIALARGRSFSRSWLPAPPMLTWLLAGGPRGHPSAS
ncbi:MAG: SMP-30/gluconolactonase/LRE family protein [Planctomycetes bacterium]|nr:SMP-30/gluconolactonase/LRE family protein [Planctomycetota bacterium]